MNQLSYHKFLVLFVVMVFLLASGATAAVKKKRFDMNGDKAVSTEQVESQKVEKEVSGSNQSFFVWLADSQKILREKVTASISAMKAGDWGAIWKFLAICLVYGMLHALGPGHGKSIVIGYFLARRGRFRQGVALGAGITFVHTLSAVLLLFALYLFFKAAVFPAFEMGRVGIEKASYALIMLTGLLLVVLGIRDIWKRHRHENQEAGGAPVASCKEMIGVAAVTGIVPCPAVALIVLFCLLNSMVSFALLGALLICVGMTVTNVSFGVAAVAFRKGIDRGASQSRFATTIYALTSILGGLIISLSGFLLFSNMFAGRV